MKRWHKRAWMDRLALYERNGAGLVLFDDVVVFRGTYNRAYNFFSRETRPDLSRVVIWRTELLRIRMFGVKQGTKLPKPLSDEN